MPANYLHGVETIEVERSGVPVKIVKSGVVGLTGSSAITTTKPVLCLNQTDDAQFGTRGTIPTALKIMRRYCNGAILVISQPLNATPVDIIGTVTEVAKSGLEQLQDSFNRYGFDPKILVAPGFDTNATVAAALITHAHKLGAVTYVDAPPGATRNQIMAARGPDGVFNLRSASIRLRYCYPFVKNGDTFESLATHSAGLRVLHDLEKGFWASHSNQALRGVTDIALPLTARIDDASSDANLLNEVGITTVFNSYGTGYRLWGNRTAAFPTATKLAVFESVRRTADIINESIRYAQLQFMDLPYNQTNIDMIVQTCGAFLRKLVGDGAILGGECWFNPDATTKEEKANGQLRISYKFTPPPPIERITNESEITTEYLLTLKAA